MRSRRLMVVEPGRIELQDGELTEDLAPSEVLVRASHSIVSPGTEGALFTGLVQEMPHRRRDVTYPARTGYGHVGEVIAAGDAVTMCKPGDTVLSFSPHASVVKADTSRMALPIPEGMSGVDAAFARMAGVSIGAVRSSSIQPGDSVVVIGLGLVGNFAAQLFGLAGANVMACDISAFRRELASKCGVGRVVGGDEVRDAVAEWTDGAGARIVVEATGLAPLADTAVACCARHGEVILLGSPRAAAVMDVTPMLARVHLEAIKVIGALEWTWPQHATERARTTITDNYRQLLRWIHDGRLVTRPLLTDLVSPRDCQRVYEGLTEHKDDHLAAVFDWAQV